MHEYLVVNFRNIPNRYDTMPDNISQTSHNPLPHHPSSAAPKPATMPNNF